MSSLWGLGLRGGDLQQLTQLALTLGALAGAVGASARCEHGDQHEDDRQHADQSCGQPVGGGQRGIAPIDQTHQIGRIGAAETVEERLVGERLAEGRTAAGLELAAGAGLLVEHRRQQVLTTAIVASSATRRTDVVAIAAQIGRRDAFLRRIAGVQACAPDRDQAGQDPAASCRRAA